MIQAIVATYYNVPWGPNDGKRAIFGNEATAVEFLRTYEVGYHHIYDGLDFNPRQETFVLSYNPPVDIETDFKALMSVNYLRVEVYSSLKAQNKGLPPYAQYYYFVTDTTPPPMETYTGDSNMGSIIARIKLDPWGTYVWGHAPFLGTGTIIEQSTPFPDNVPMYGARAVNIPAASVPYLGLAGTSNQSFGENRRETVYALGEPFGGSYVLNDPPTVKNDFFFVGIFGREGGAQSLALCRPFATFADDLDYHVTLDVLMSITKIKSSLMDPQTFKTTDELTGTAFNVDLLRAYLIPRQLFQDYFSAMSDGRILGYQIDYAAGVGDYSYRALSLALLDTSSTARPAVQHVELPFNPTRILTNGASAEEVGNKVLFADVGTPFTRLEITPNTDEEYAAVDFTGFVSNAGYVLLMRSGGRQVDLGGDFEIPVPDNAQAEAYARNKWSVALQGVSNVGSIAIAAASKNPIAFVGAAVSTGQYIANIAEGQSVPATIQGQGNGHALYAIAKIKYIKEAGYEICRGAVYGRYAFYTEREGQIIARYGYKWKSAVVDTEGGAMSTPTVSAYVFGGDNATTYPRADRRYFKTAGAVVKFPIDTLTPRTKPQPPADYIQEIEELLNNGLTVYYEPAQLAEESSSGAFGH